MEISSFYCLDTMKQKEKPGYVSPSGPTWAQFTSLFIIYRESFLLGDPIKTTYKILTG